MISPVIDFELYGDNEKNPPNVQKARAVLNALSFKLDDYYDIKPNIYAIEKDI